MFVKLLFIILSIFSNETISGSHFNSINAVLLRYIDYAFISSNVTWIFEVIKGSVFKKELDIIGEVIFS